MHRLANITRVCLFLSLAPLFLHTAGVWVSLPWMLHCVCMRQGFCACEPVFTGLSRDAAISGPQFFQERNKDEGALGIRVYSMLPCS